MMMAVGECLQEDPYTRMPVGQCLSPILVDHESNSSITKCISFLYVQKKDSVQKKSSPEARFGPAASQNQPYRPPPRPQT